MNKTVLDYRPAARPIEITPLELRQRDRDRQRVARRLLLLLLIAFALILATEWICVNWYHVDF